MLQLRDIAKRDQQIKSVALNERLPGFIKAPCQLRATYFVEVKDRFYLIHLRVEGELNIICQRCMQEFTLPYDNATVIAVCRDDEQAEELLEQYESVVSPNGLVDLNDLIIDELHLYVPQFHAETRDCGDEINEILMG